MSNPYTATQHDHMIPARTSEEREAFVVEVWNMTRDWDDDRVSSYAGLVEDSEDGDFPESVWPYRFAMISAAHRGDEIADVLRCYRYWDEMLHASTTMMALDDPEYPRYALDMDTREYWHADMSIALRRGR